jgi:hypothetical protein
MEDHIMVLKDRCGFRKLPMLLEVKLRVEMHHLSITSGPKDRRKNYPAFARARKSDADPNLSKADSFHCATTRSL